MARTFATPATAPPGGVLLAAAMTTDVGDCTYLAKQLPVTAAEVERIHEAAHQAKLLTPRQPQRDAATQPTDGSTMPW